MSEHTPGPWTDCDRVIVVTSATHGYDTWIANFAVGGAGSEEQCANARLAAAAPDLLDAILKSDNAHWTPAMRAAINKATGCVAAGKANKRTARIEARLARFT